MSARPEEREEPSGNGAGVSIRNVVQARNMDSLSTRLEITNVIERNKTQPTERTEGYNVTRANDTITVVRSEQVTAEEERYYDAHTLPDNSEWLQLLRKHRQSGTKFTGKLYIYPSAPIQQLCELTAIVRMQTRSFLRTRRRSTVM